MTDADQLVCLQIMVIGPQWTIFTMVDHVMLGMKFWVSDGTFL